MIVVHPSKYAFSWKIANEYEKIRKEKGDEIEVLDLYASENRQDFLIFENIKEMPMNPSFLRMQEKISASDELVFIFPMWWYSEPAILKNFWDNNFTGRYAYRYVDGKPVGLLGGKTARVFITADGPNFFHYLLCTPIRNIWWLTRLRFCGIKMKSFVIFDKMFRRDEQAKLKFLERVRRIASA